MTADLESRIRRLEDRALIGERVIKYAMAVDHADWEMFADCFTDPMHADYSENGMPAADFARDDFVGIVRGALSRFTATQHPSERNTSSNAAVNLLLRSWIRKRIGSARSGGSAPPGRRTSR